MQSLNILVFTNETQAFQVRDAVIKLEDEDLDELGKRLWPLPCGCTILKTTVNKRSGGRNLENA
ncbi:MAG: hypothetical protein PHY43_13720 [Verrucomicrobiales bacterium]|nr:hypothetical protein [Verrucomicrobiales bacterium]